MYQTASVSAPASCQSELQNRTCNDGSWEWSGSYSNSSCSVKARCSNPDKEHGGSGGTRTMYQIASVNAPASCQSESQSRTCNDGSWEWSGSYIHSACTVKARCSNPDKGHGGSESRNSYLSASVDAPASCQSESQTRTCNDGAWSGWSGSYSHSSCSVKARCSNPDKEHGGSDSRTAYLSASVSAPAFCPSEPQTRTCSDGAWSGWSGSYSYSACTIKARCSNPDTEHGGSDSTRTRTRYASASVNAPASCQSEFQTQTCNDGSWEWSGSYSQSACTVKSRCSNPDKEHGGSESRIMYQRASVEMPASCQNESQTRTCDNGNWSAWPGFYNNSRCIVNVPGSLQEESGGGVSAGVIVLILILLCCCCVAIGACVYVGYHSPSAVWPFEEKDSSQPDVDKSARPHQPDAKSPWEEPCQPDVSKFDPPVRSKSFILHSRGRANAEAWEKATFENSNYCKLYSELGEVKHDYLSGCGVVSDFIDEVGKTHNVAPDVVSNYKNQVCSLFKHGCDAKEMAVKLWTCAELFEERELCSHLNAAVRGDELHLIQKAVRMCRLLNTLVVSSRCRKALEENVLLGKSTYRGLGMPEEHFAFFTPGKMYRAPMYLSSSFDPDVAKDFMRNNSGDGNLPVLVTIQFDAELGCAHAHYLEAVTVVKGEKEILMPPYSGFVVVSADFDPNGMSKFTIKAFHDNRLQCLQNVPLAPWH